jgi:hypothetical protein
MEMAVKTMKRAVRGAGRRRRGELLPCRRHHEGAPPVSPFLYGFLGALPHGDGIHGGGKNVAFGGCNSWVEESPMSYVSSLYIASRIFVTPSRVATDRAYLGRPGSESVKFYV